MNRPENSLDSIVENTRQLRSTHDLSQVIIGDIQYTPTPRVRQASTSLPVDSVVTTQPRSPGQGPFALPNQTTEQSPAQSNEHALESDDNSEASHSQLQLPHSDGLESDTSEDPIISHYIVDNNHDQADVDDYFDLAQESMAVNALLNLQPDTFKGTGTEDPDEWIRSIEYWFSFKKITAED